MKVNAKSLQNHAILEMTSSYVFRLSLRKHAYSNILNISSSKTERFWIKNSDILHSSAQNIDCEYALNRLAVAVLTRTHNLCFEQK